MASEHMPSIRPFSRKKLKCWPAAATYPCNASLKWQFGSQSRKQRQRRLPITGKSPKHRQIRELDEERAKGESQRAKYRHFAEILSPAFRQIGGRGHFSDGLGTPT